MSVGYLPIDLSPSIKSNKARQCWPQRHRKDSINQSIIFNINMQTSLLLSSQTLASLFPATLGKIARPLYTPQACWRESVIKCTALPSSDPNSIPSRPLDTQVQAHAHTGATYTHHLDTREDEDAERRVALQVSLFRLPGALLVGAGRMVLRETVMK